jgi:hypothetical protein
MPKLVKTIVNNNPGGVKPWIDTNEYLDYFTQQQIDEVITPYTDFVHNLPGFVSVTVEEINGNLVIKHEFDTTDNMRSAQSVLGGPNANSIVVLRNNLFTEKLKQLGANSSVSITFE